MWYGDTRMNPDTGSNAPSGPQIIVESLYALLAVGSVILFGLREPRATRTLAINQ